MKPEFSISILRSADLDAVDTLMKRHRRTLGFLPTEALRDYLATGTVLGAKGRDDQLVAYLLYSSNPDRFRIVHLCVSEEFRGQGIAKQLLNTLKDSGTTQTAIKLSCRRDFPAHHMWPRLGFVSYRRKARAFGSPTSFDTLASRFESRQSNGIRLVSRPDF